MINECFKWSLVSYLNPADRNLARVRKADKDFPKKPEKLEKFTKLKKRIPSALVFLVMKIRENIQFMYQKMLRRKSC